MEVPLDYADPTGKTLSLAVLRVPATDRRQRVGQLVVNPGGPGGSGVQYAAGGAQVFGEQLTRLFDIVGFDPRGRGPAARRSTCMDTAQTDTVIASDPDPDTPAEVAELDRLTRDFGEGCLTRAVTSRGTCRRRRRPRDIDVLRDALGEPELDYFGASYGTLLGATYADLFPDNVGRMVLDGAIDPSLSNEELVPGPGQGFRGRAARLPGRTASPRVTVSAATPSTQVPVGSGSSSTTSTPARCRPAPTASSPPAWPRSGSGCRSTSRSTGRCSPSALEKAYDGNGRGAAAVSPTSTPPAATKEYADNSIEALYAVNCLDHDDYIESDKVPSRFAQFDAASPTFGRSFAYGLSTLRVLAGQVGERRPSTVTAAGARADRRDRHDP